MIRETVNDSARNQRLINEYRRMTQLGNEYERKQVYQIRCGHCQSSLTNRGMNVCLDSNENITKYHPYTYRF